MKTCTPDELRAVIEAHGLWLCGNGGQRANLQGAYLRGANLRGAYLRGAYLQGAYLRGANLQGAYLRGANLQGANLRGADLQGAYLRGANLQGADLQGAVYKWAQVAFSGHGECGRMLTAYIQSDGMDPVYQCGCFFGTLDDLKGYIANGEECHKASRTLAMKYATKLLTA